MATIKSFTSLEQSRKLAEILPLESADMYYISGDKDDICFGSGVYEEIVDWLSDGTPRPADIPCWSLSALLNVLAKQDFIIKSSERNNECQYNIDIPSRHCKIWFSSLLDAAFEMIIWLKENNKL